MSVILPETLRGRAEKLASARKKGELGLDIEPIATLGEAYLCHAHLAASLGKTVAGWKVARSPEFGSVAAPMFADEVLTGPARWPFRPGLIAEVELATRFSRDLAPGHEPEGAAENAEKQAFVGVELVQSRLSQAARASFLTGLSDCLSNIGYVAGAELQSWPDFDIDTRRCLLTLDGDVLFDGLCKHTMGGPMAPLAGYVAAGGDHLGGFKAGQVITTGSLCGMVEIPRKGRLVATIDGLGSVTIDLV